MDWSTSLRSQIVNEVVNLFGVQMISECWHALAAIVYLGIDFCRLASLSYVGEAWAVAAAYPGYAVAMNAAGLREQLATASF